MKIRNEVVFEKSEIEKIKILLASAMLITKKIDKSIYWEDVENKIREVNKYLDAVWNMLGG